jgi:hypothetical protein
MEPPLGASTLCEFFIAQFENEFTGLAHDQYPQVLQIITDYLHRASTYDQANSLFSSISSSSTLLDHIREIVEVSHAPIPEVDSPACTRTSARRKMKMWSHGEDVRLLSGIYRFGLTDWASIARFVGHSRTRGQCAQRWTRGLDPRISKVPWNATENAQLLHLVHVYGERSWMKISSVMTNRSDVQCRYRYNQLKRGIAYPFMHRPPPPHSKSRARTPPPVRLPPPPYAPAPIPIPSKSNRTLPRANEKSERVAVTPESVSSAGKYDIAYLLNVH